MSAKLIPVTLTQTARIVMVRLHAPAIWAMKAMVLTVWVRHLAY